MAIVQVCRYGVGIIVGGNKGKFRDKVEDFENGEGTRGKDKNDIRKRFSREGEIADKDDKEKYKNKAGGAEN